MKFRLSVVVFVLAIVGIAVSASVVEAATLKVTVIGQWGDPLQSAGYWQARADFHPYEYRWWQGGWILLDGPSTPKNCGWGYGQPIADGCADENGVMYFNNIAPGYALVQVGAKNHQAVSQLVLLQNDSSFVEIEVNLRQTTIGIYPTGDLQVTGMRVTLNYQIGNTGWRSQDAIVTAELTSMGRNSFHAVSGRQEVRTPPFEAGQWYNWQTSFDLPVSVSALPTGVEICITLRATSPTDPLRILGESRSCGPKQF